MQKQDWRPDSRLDEKNKRIRVLDEIYQFKLSSYAYWKRWCVVKRLITLGRVDAGEVDSMGSFVAFVASQTGCDSFAAVYSRAGESQVLPQKVTHLRGHTT